MSANLEDPAVAYRTGKGQSSSQFPRRVVLKNVIATRQLHSSPMLVRSCLKSCMLGLSIMQTKSFQMSKLNLEKEEELEIKLPTSIGSQKKQGNSRKISTSASQLKSLAQSRKHRHEIKDQFQTGKRVHQGCILSLCLFKLYAEHIMQKCWIA